MAVDTKELDRRLADLLQKAKALVQAIEDARKALGLETGQAAGEMMSNRRAVEF